MVGARGGTTGRHDQTVIGLDSVILHGRRNECSAARRSEAGRSGLSKARFGQAADNEG